MRRKIKPEKPPTLLFPWLGNILHGDKGWLKSIGARSKISDTCNSGNSARISKTRRSKARRRWAKVFVARVPTVTLNERAGETKKKKRKTNSVTSRRSID